MDFRDYLPSKYWKYLDQDVTYNTSIDSGIAAYHGEDNVTIDTYEFGNRKKSHDTKIFPALVNIAKNNELRQISVILYMQ